MESVWELSTKFSSAPNIDVVHELRAKIAVTGRRGGGTAQCACRELTAIEKSKVSGTATCP